MDKQGDFYGTAEDAFELTFGADGWIVTVIHYFGNPPDWGWSLRHSYS
jgi:hypothetical protein